MAEIRIARKLTAANDEIAAGLRARFEKLGVFAFNVLGSPGAGKTSLLEKAAAALKGKARVGVIEGDLETARDAERMEHAGVRAVQITTGKGCHLNAGMVQDGLESLGGDSIDVLFIENVGNLVCPAGFDLGEKLRILVSSVTEGDDKPGKYPPAFAFADVLVLNKTDLLPYVDFDVERFIREAKSIKPSLEVFQVSCRTGEGIERFAQFLAGRVSGPGCDL